MNNKNKNTKFKKKCLIFLIVMITVLTFFLITQNSTGKPTHIINNIDILEEIKIPSEAIKKEILPPNCYLKIEFDNISGNVINSRIGIIYDQPMDTSIKPNIELTNNDIRYYFEDSEWLDNKTFQTKIYFEKQQIGKSYIIIKDAISHYRLTQNPLFSETENIFFTINTIGPQIEKIHIFYKYEIAIIELEYNEEIYLNKEFEKKDIFFGTDNLNYLNNFSIESNKKKIIFENKSSLTKENLNNYEIEIKEDLLKNKNNNTNGSFKHKFNADSAYVEVIEYLYEDEGEDITDDNTIDESPTDEDTTEENVDITITEFEIEPLTNRAIVYFNEGVFSNDRLALSVSNFVFKKNETPLDNFIKSVSHIAGENKAVILFNEHVVDFENLKLECINIYNEENNSVLEINAYAKNTRQSLPLNKGWNLISIPLELSDNWRIESNVSDTTSNIDIYKFINSEWVVQTNIKSAGAVFIYSQKPQELFLSYKRTENNQLDLTTLDTGWNLVGLYNNNLENLFTINDVITNFENLNVLILKGVIHNTYEFEYDFNNENQYFLSPYEGYWVYIE